MAYDLKIFTENIDGATTNQIYTLMAQPPFASSRVRIMPDAHIGTGCVVGFTATMSDKIIPNVIGVDIGCGMLTVCLGKIYVDLPSLDNFIVNNIPTGARLRDEYSEVRLIKELRCYDELRSLDRIIALLERLVVATTLLSLTRTMRVIYI